MNIHQFYQHRRGDIKGFTLIELLVVIAIIVLLVSILVPSLKSAKELAYQAVCLNTMRSNVNAASIYVDNNNERYAPAGYYKPSSGSLGYTRLGPWWHRDVMGKYMGLDHITSKYPDPEGPILCPAQPVECEKSFIGYNDSMCGDAHTAFRFREGIVKNNEMDSLGYTKALPFAFGPKLQDVTLSTDCIVLFEDGRQETFKYVTKYKTCNPDNDTFYPEGGVTGSSIPHQPDYRHSDGVNYGFMDGHAAHMDDSVEAFVAGKITQFYK